MRYPLLLVVAAVLAGPFRAAPATHPATSSRTLDSVATDVGTLVSDFMRDENVAGVAVGIMRGRDVIHTKGYGWADLERRTPVTEHTVFRIASLTKQFTAVSVLMLAEQGRIDLDAGIRRYFPEFPAGGPDPTVSQLLNHTSGFDFQDSWTAEAPPATADPSQSRDLSPAALTRLFASTKFAFAPGTQFRYNNNAFALLGLLIERISGESYATFVRRRIFEPVGMTASRYVDPSSLITHRAAGYSRSGSALINAAPNNLHASFSAGALGSTVVDLLTWRRALLDNRILGADMSARMTTPGLLSDGMAVPYGYGLFLLSMDGRTKIDHYGNTPGFRSEIAYYPSSQLTVVVLANTNPARTDVLESRISRRLMNMPEATVTEIALTSAELAGYAGTYLVTDASISHRSVPTEISVRPDGLYAGLHRLRPVSREEFVPAGDPYHHYTFTLRDGRAVRLRVEREGRVIADAARVDAGPR